MKIIGRIDKVDFPELDLTNIDVKIDSGAYTSTIHSHHINEIIIDGEKYVEFQLLDPNYAKFRDVFFKTKHYKKRRVKNSFGKSAPRFVIETKIVLFNKEYSIELSLSERSDMKFPVLIGRKLINKKFLIDTSKQNISYQLKQQKEENNKK